MAISPIAPETKFSEWADITNQLITAVGDLSVLDSQTKLNLVVALNEVNAKFGTMSNLSTTQKTTVVAALNELVGSIGTLASLNTTAKGNTVVAINEVNTKVGTLSNLNTTEKANLVAAINEVFEAIDGMTSDTDSKVGNLDNLTTSVKTNAVAAINELDAMQGDPSTLSTVAKESLVAAVNELDLALAELETYTTETFAATDGEIGDLTALDTIADGNLVEAINELAGNQIRSRNIPVDNKEMNHGRFAAEPGKLITAFVDSSVCLKPYNAAVITAGDKFIHDNSDHGGAGGTLGTDMSLLVTALSNAGRLSNRSGFEFYIANFTAGGGSADSVIHNSRVYYPIVSTEDAFLSMMQSDITYQYWIRCKSVATSANEGVLVGEFPVATYINEVSTGGGAQLVTPADGWVHVRHTINLSNEFMTFMPLIKANVNDVIQIALPCLYRARVDNGIHVGVA